MPISGTPFAVAGNDTNDGAQPTILNTYKYEAGKFTLAGYRLGDEKTNTRLYTFWIAVCK